MSYLRLLTQCRRKYTVEMARQTPSRGQDRITKDPTHNTRRTEEAAGKYLPTRVEQRWEDGTDDVVGPPKAPCSFSTLALISHFSCLFFLPPKAKPWAAYPYLQRGVVATGARAGGRAGRLFLTQVAKVRFQRNIPTPTSRQASTSGTPLLSHYTILSLVSHAPLPGLLRKPSFPSFGNTATFPLVSPSLGFYNF